MSDTKKVLVVMPVDLVTEIDGQRGAVNRSEWIVQACHGQLARDEPIAPVTAPRPKRVVGRKLVTDERQPRRDTRQATPVPKSNWPK